MKEWKKPVISNLEVRESEHWLYEGGIDNYATDTDVPGQVTQDDGSTVEAGDNPSQP